MQTFTDSKKCTSCRCWRNNKDYINKNGRILKTCLRCRFKIKDPWEIEDFNMPDSDDPEDTPILNILHDAFNDATYNEKYNYINYFMEEHKEWWWLIGYILEEGEINV